MRPETYMEKNGFIYGASIKDGRAVYVLKFKDLDDAQAWLDTEEYEFRTRELCSRARAKELAGRFEVELVDSLDYI